MKVDPNNSYHITLKVGNTFMDFDFMTLDLLEAFFKKDIRVTRIVPMKEILKIREDLKL